MVIAGNSHPELAELIAKYVFDSFITRVHFSQVPFYSGVWGSKSELLQFTTKPTGKPWLTLLTLLEAKTFTSSKQEPSTKQFLSRFSASRVEITSVI